MKDDLRGRTKAFALGTAVLCARIGRKTETAHIHSQLLRASSSVAANYRAACRARSRAEFISKMGTVEEESDESQFWLEFLYDLHQALGFSLGSAEVAEWKRLISEAEELLKISVASKKTARRGL